MRPVRRGAPPHADDYADYRDATGELVSRLGPYCSYCERHVVTQLAVEHIQPKGLAQYAHLAGRWHNFLLACVNCNSTKGDRDVPLAEHLLPDRDNTALGYEYPKDGTVVPAAGPIATVAAAAQATWALVGLDKPISVTRDMNGKQVALDRVAQRKEAWLLALDAADEVAAQPANHALRRLTINLAKSVGFFSIWMAAFAHDPDMRARLIAAFPGTEGSGCFDPQTTAPVSPAPNPDGLPDGGKV